MHCSDARHVELSGTVEDGTPGHSEHPQKTRNTSQKTGKSANYKKKNLEKLKNERGREVI